MTLQGVTEKTPVKENHLTNRCIVRNYLKHKEEVNVSLAALDIVFWGGRGSRGSAGIPEDGHKVNFFLGFMNGPQVTMNDHASACYLK